MDSIPGLGRGVLSYIYKPWDPGPRGAQVMWFAQLTSGSPQSPKPLNYRLEIKCHVSIAILFIYSQDRYSQEHWPFHQGRACSIARSLYIPYSVLSSSQIGPPTRRAVNQVYSTSWDWSRTTNLGIEKMCLTEIILTHEIGRKLHKIGICIVSSIVSQTWIILSRLQIRYPVCKCIIYRASLADSTLVVVRIRGAKLRFNVL